MKKFLLSTMCAASLLLPSIGRGQSAPTPPNPVAPITQAGPTWTTGWSNAWKTKMDYSRDDILLAKRFGVVADGVTSDDVALASAITYCGTKGARLILPPGKILLTGASSTTATIQNCTIQGSGFPLGIGATPASFGTTILLTSTSIKPFILKLNWAIEGINFFWPNQTSGTTAYPPLFSDNGVDRVGTGYIDKVIIVNAYDGFKSTASIDWSNINISNASMYAVHDLFTLSLSGDSWRITNIHFTHGPWANIVGSAANTAINVATTVNSIFKIISNVYQAAVVISISNSTSFAWRYGIKAESGGIFANSLVDVVWDGVGTMMDSSAGGCFNATTFRGSGLASYVPLFDMSGGVIANPAYIVPAFNFGPNTGGNCNGPLLHNINMIGLVAGSAVVSAGQDINLINFRGSHGSTNDGTDTYFVHATANQGGLTVRVQDSTSNGYPSSTKHHGVVVDISPANLIIQNNTFAYENDAVTAVSAGGGDTIITGNASLATTGTKSIILTGSAGVIHRDNAWDKPPKADIVTPGDCGGTNEAVTGALSGQVLVGTTNPTTACKIRLPWVPYGVNVGRCTASLYGSLTPISATVAGTPPSWTFSSGAVDMHSNTLMFDCKGQN